MLRKQLFLILVIASFFVSSKITHAQSEVKKYYDLTVAEITASPKIPAANQTCILTVKVKNASTWGLYSATGVTSYNANFDNFSILEQKFTPPSYDNLIPANGYLFYTYEGKFTSAGKQNLYFAIDTEDDLIEKDENNNSLTAEIEIFDPSEADLSIASVDFSAEEIFINELLTITVTLKNTGKTYITEPTGFSDNDIQTSFYSFDITGRRHDAFPSITAPLEPNGTFDWRYMGKFTQYGTHSVSLTLDKSNFLKESDENNNATNTVANVYLNREAADMFEMSPVAISGVSSTSVMVSWTTTKESAAKIKYRELYNLPEEEVKSSSSAKETKLYIENLKPNTQYYYRAIATKGTYTKETSESTFIVPAGDGLEFVGNINATVNNNSRSVYFDWSTNLISTGHVYYRKVASTTPVSVGLKVFSIRHGISVPNLEPAEYKYFVVSTSTPGTVAKSQEYGFKIKNTASANSSIFPTKQETTISPTNQSQNVSGHPIPTYFEAVNEALHNRLKGNIILKVESKGEAYYMHPGSKKVYYLGRPNDAFNIMREQGVGITNSDLEKIPISTSGLTGIDSDGDGLPDIFEDAVGTDKLKPDTDMDGYNDKTEFEGGHSPLRKGSKMDYDNNFSNGRKGKIFLQVEGKGEAWFINPKDGKRYFLGRPSDAFNVMRNLGLGISNADFINLSVNGQ